MADRLAIFHPSGVFGPTANPFGKDIANRELFGALARHGGFSQLDVLGLRPPDAAAAEADLLDGRPGARLQMGSILNQRLTAAAGAVLRGQPDLYDLAWLRRRTTGDRAYSLLGLVHTIAPPAIRQMIAMASAAPTYPWDAVICTSPSVRDALAEMFGSWGEHLAERTGGRPPPHPALPVVPLGVEAERFAALADRPAVRTARRAALGVASDAVLVLWVGRLSYFEKAFPQAMFRALQRAAAETGVRFVFAMAGWFPAEADRDLYAEAAQALAPDVPVCFLDGNDQALVGELWAAADIFLSLVDNIQETFGITPLEAMAAALPVVASDWDGYRATVRDGIDGVLVPTLLGPSVDLGPTMVQRHVFGAASYQAYVGEVAQHTAVHVGRAAAALAELARSATLRRRMGAAGQARVAAEFDWPIIARRHHALVDQLADERARAAAGPPTPTRNDPARNDPFADFIGFSSHRLGLDLPLRAAAGVTGDDVRRLSGALDLGFAGLRATPEACAAALDRLAAEGPMSLRRLLAASPIEQRRPLALGLAWMAKLGLVDWLA
jgi:glycosyltransferase involved in cell wall biosynthesis